jgi:hypothetical protein
MDRGVVALRLDVAVFNSPAVMFMGAVMMVVALEVEVMVLEPAGEERACARDEGMMLAVASSVPLVGVVWTSAEDTSAKRGASEQRIVEVWRFGFRGIL